MKKVELASTLQQFRDYEAPDIALEQYTLDAACAADIVYIAGFEHDDIGGKRVLDLGCGVGRLTGGALLFGAGQAVGVDVDLGALRIARENLGRLGLDGAAELVQADVRGWEARFREPESWTVLANPPFGVHDRGADTRFIRPALARASVLYVLHHSDRRTREFLVRFYEGEGFVVDLIYELEVVLEKTYQFHSKRRKRIRVNLYRVLRARH
ncbi:MAG: METTL5 family protein [Promethearchaeota archaeon]